MSDSPDSFVVHLGGGLYLDSLGKLSTGPQSPRQQVYDAAGGLKFDYIEAGKTLGEISSFLSDPETREWIHKLHISTVPMSVLWVGAQVIASVTLVLSVAALTIGVMLAMIKIVADEDEGIAPELEQHLKEIKEDLKLIDDRLTADQVLSVLDAFRKTATHFRSNLQDTKIQNLQGAARIAKHAEMVPQIEALDTALELLTRQDWSPIFRFEDYKQLFMISAAAGLHVRNPDGSYETFQQRAVPRRFDYRFGLAIFAYVACVYPVLLAAAVPWFRSSGTYAAQLRQLAGSIDRFVQRMYSESFARTIHTPQSLAYSEGWLPYKHRLGPDGFPADGRRLSLEDEYLVGAVDLVRYTDAWFHGEFSDQYFGEGEDTGRRGAFDYCWPRDGRKYVEPNDAAAAEANEQSERDYSELKLTSGMVQLAAAAANLRFLSTPPLVSQTVSGVTTHSRRLVSEEDTEANGSWVFGTSQVRSEAKLRKFEARAKATVQTQARGYPFSFNYRVRLVSVDHSIANTSIWANRAYGDHIWKGEYVPASGDENDRRLDVTISRNGLLHEHMIYEGHSPTDPIVWDGELTFKATTFDWYVPEAAAVQGLDPDVTEASIAALQFKTAQYSGRPAGGRSIHLERPAPMKLLKDEGRPISWQVRTRPTFDVLFAEYESVADGHDVVEKRSFELAERRWAQDEEVKIKWRLTWLGQNLTLTVEGVPENRPFQLLLVVEEDVYSGETPPEDLANPTDLEELRTQLHTTFPLEVVNQLVIVPGDFFYKEKAALETGASIWGECNERFAISESVDARPSRREQYRRLRKLLGDSESTDTLAEKHNRQLALVLATSPDLFNEVVERANLTEADLERLARYI